jgi:hypothetical protein
MRNVFRPNDVFAVVSFQATHCEMTFRQVLKMLDESVVHHSAAKRTHDWKRLRGYLLRHHHSKARRHLSNEAYENWGSLFDNTALCNEASVTPLAIMPRPAKFRFQEHRRILLVRQPLGPSMPSVSTAAPVPSRACRGATDPCHFAIATFEPSGLGMRGGGHACMTASLRKKLL